ncbi:MAG TPA: single-stranded DNA-binding protein [Mycobacteriales bacterium]|nr:single-stranded DNA-binding protein [Mycobacteriales bacterium]
MSDVQTGGRTVVTSRGARRAQPDGEERATAPRNEVVLVGRVSAAAEERELPSGDLLVSWRVVVDRPPPRRPTPEGVRLPTSDVVVCVAWSTRVRRTAASLSVGDVVQVTGALRQRFWRAGGSLGSRTEVEVETLRRLARAG